MVKVKKQAGPVCFSLVKSASRFHVSYKVGEEGSDVEYHSSPFGTSIASKLPAVYEEMDKLFQAGAFSPQETSSEVTAMVPFCPRCVGGVRGAFVFHIVEEGADGVDARGRR